MNSQIPYNSLIPKYSQMGFTENEISKAWQQANGDENRLLDILCNNNSNSKPEEPSVSPIQPKTALIAPVNERAPLEHYPDNMRLRAEKRDLNKTTDNRESLNPEQKLRQHGASVGLKNVGNTCYVNSLLQTYFMSPSFVSAILNYNPDVTIVDEIRPSVLSRGDSDLRRRRIEASIELVKNLRKLFSLMIKSHKKYLEPTEVMRSVVDDTARVVHIGEQKDVTEYHLNFLARIEEAFAYQDTFFRRAKEDRSGSGRWFNPFRQRLESMAESVELKKRLSMDDSDLKRQDAAMIKDHFFGKMKEFRTFTQYGRQVIEEADSLFGPLILDISNNRDIYEGFDKYCNVDIEDFKAPNGEIVKAEQKIWITRAPEFLVFQLNRVSFDTRYGFAYKNNKTFEFDTEIFLDRYMIENKEESVRVGGLVKALREQLQKNEEKLQGLMNCLGSGHSAPEVLGNAEGFLNFQLNAQNNYEEDTLPVVIIEEESVTDNEVQTAMKVLRAYKKSLEAQIVEITDNIQKIKDEINNLLASLKQKKYHLVSILIHAGDSGRGHYYSFNRNVVNNTWRKFNDTAVVPETYERVMQEAIGGLGNASAYCLVYLADPIVQQEREALNINPQGSIQGIQIEKEYYDNLIPRDLIEYVNTDNQLFHAKIDSFKFNSNLSYAMSQYQWKYQVTERVADRKSAIPSRFDSFATFLKSEPHTDKLLRWYLLDISLKETGCCQTLRDLDSSPKLAIIQEKLSFLSKPYAFKISLTPSEKDELDKKLAQYIASYPIMICYNFLLKSFISNNLKDACYATRRILFMESKEKNNNFSLIKDLVRVVCLKLALKGEHYIKNNRLEETEETINYLAALTKGVLKKDDIHVEQAKVITNDAIKQVKDTVSAEDLSLLKQEAYKISTGLHRINELEKEIKDYKGQKIEEEIELFMIGDTYGWKDIDREGASYELAKLIEDFKKTYHAYIQFHDILLKDKKVVQLEERKACSLVVVSKSNK